MRKVALGLALALVCMSSAALAQEYPGGEIFGGFSVYDGGSTVYGWQASGAANVSEHLGLVADFGGQYDDLLGNAHQFLFGPRVRSSRATWVGFAHALFGGQRLSASGFSTSGFAMGIGGGLDVNTDRGVGFRLVQVDWVPTRISGSWFTDQMRLGFGITIPLGN